jgi:hypothetical protein
MCVEKNPKHWVYSFNKYVLSTYSAKSCFVARVVNSKPYTVSKMAKLGALLELHYATKKNKTRGDSYLVWG